MNPPSNRLDPKIFGLKVVSMHLEGIGIQTIAKKLTEETQTSVSWRQVSNLIKGPDCQRIMTELNESAMATAKSYARQKAAGLMTKAFEVLEHHLKNRKSLHAVGMIFKVAGVDVEEKQSTQATTLNVIMPGAEEKQVIDVAVNEVRQDERD